MTLHDDRRSPTGVVTLAEPLDGGAGQHRDRLLLVVGYDGSEAARRALATARQLISGRTGSIEVVFVAHAPMGAELSPQAQSELHNGFDAAEVQCTQEVEALMDGLEARWRFHRRDGLIAHELVAFADEISREYGGEASVIIVVGRAMQPFHHVVGSVPVALVRHARYPVVVVP